MILVKKIASSVSAKSGASFEDLVQVGSLGLMKAIDSYNIDKNTKFTTYASYFIRGELMHYLRDKVAMIKTPRKVQEMLVKVYQASKYLTEFNNSEPTVQAIADYINTTPEAVEEVMKVDKYKFMVSLDQAIGMDDEESLLIDKIPANDYQESQNQYETKLLVENSINKLPAELRQIIELSFFEDLNQREIADNLGISPMQVSRKLKKALNMMYDIIRGEQDE